MGAVRMKGCDLEKPGLNYLIGASGVGKMKGFKQKFWMPGMSDNCNGILDPHSHRGSLLGGSSATD